MHLMISSIDYEQMIIQLYFVAKQLNRFYMCVWQWKWADFTWISLFEMFFCKVHTCGAPCWIYSHTNYYTVSQFATSIRFVSIQFSLVFSICRIKHMCIVLIAKQNVWLIELNEFRIYFAKQRHVSSVSFVWLDWWWSSSSSSHVLMTRNHMECNK